VHARHVAGLVDDVLVAVVDALERARLGARERGRRAVGARFARGVERGLDALPRVAGHARLEPPEHPVPQPELELDPFVPVLVDPRAQLAHDLVRLHLRLFRGEERRPLS
jgi:hypothetical protein